MADSLSIFTEGTFEEQIQELVKYLARSEADENRTAFVRRFQDALNVSDGELPLEEDEEKRRRVIRLLLSEVKGLGEGNDREIEGFFNMVYAHLLALYPPDSPDSTQLVTTLIGAITSTTSAEHVPVKYRILSNLFNALPNRSTLRPRAYKALLDLATENEELDVLQINNSDIEKWLDEWDITADEKSDFLKNISDVFAKIGQDEISYTYLVSYAKSIPSHSPKAEAAALDTITTSLRLPLVFNFEPVLKVDVIRVIKDHPAFALFKILLGGGLTDFHTWLEQNEDVLKNFNLDKTQLKRKMRLLILADLGSKNIGRDVPYSEISSSLQIEPEEVEAWVIDGIRARLISGRLSQPGETLHVTQAMSRSFTKFEWETIEKRLLAWKSGLQGVLEVMAAARRSAAAVTTVGANHIPAVDGVGAPQPQAA